MKEKGFYVLNREKISAATPRKPIEEVVNYK